MRRPVLPDARRPGLAGHDPVHGGSEHAVEPDAPASTSASLHAPWLRRWLPASLRRKPGRAGRCDFLPLRDRRLPGTALAAAHLPLRPGPSHARHPAPSSFQFSPSSQGPWRQRPAGRPARRARRSHGARRRGARRDAGHRRSALSRMRRLRAAGRHGVPPLRGTGRGDGRNRRGVAQFGRPGESSRLGTVCRSALPCPALPCPSNAAEHQHLERPLFVHVREHGRVGHALHELQLGCQLAHLVLQKGRAQLRRVQAQQRVAARGQ